MSAAFKGIIHALKAERSFRTQTTAAALVLVMLIAVRPEPVWWAMLGTCVGSVLGLELVNTALEAVVDRLHPDEDSSIRIAKDCAAGAVLVMSAVSLAVFVAFVASRL